MYNTLIRWCLAGMPPFEDNDSIACRQDELCTSCVISAASTGNASLLLIGGGTVHRQFFVPNDVDEKTACRVSVESKTAEKLRQTQLIVIDVFFTNNFILLKYIFPFNL